MHRILFGKIFHNKKCIDKFCDDQFNAFHNVCRKWYLYDNPQSKNIENIQKIYSFGNTFKF